MNSRALLQQMALHQTFALGFYKSSYCRSIGIKMMLTLLQKFENVKLITSAGLRKVLTQNSGYYRLMQSNLF
uniref:Uncharacterized protein n=1 Tax=Romanomermis culicivorax TaxID=13658 RepID=A0A915HU95_ROMCU